MEKIITISLCILALFWSIWFWSNNPAPIFSTDKCWTDDSPRQLKRELPYCKGFDDGYQWQRTQSALDCHINEAIK